MKRFLFLSILYLCLCASAQTPTFTVSAPNQAIVGEKFNLVFTTNARKASGFRISSVVSIPKEIGGLHVVGCPPLPQQKEASVSESTPTIAYTYILRGDSVGTYTIPAAFLTVDGKELETTPVEVRIQSADAARPEEAAAQTAGSPSQTQEKKELLAPTADAKTPRVDLSKWKGMGLRQANRNNAVQPYFKKLLRASSVKKIVINNYETSYRFSDGMLAVCNEDTGTWGFYDEDGNQLPGGFKWSKPLPMSQDFAFGADHCIVFEHVLTGSGFHNYLCYILDKKGNAKRLPAGDNASCVWPFNNGGIAAVETSGIYVSFFNTKGEQVLKGIHAEEDATPIGDFIDGWAKLYGGMEKGYTYVNKQGKTIGKYWLKAQNFSEGLAAVYEETPNGRRWGFIDTTGKMVIEPRFSYEPDPFSCGYALLSKQNGNMVFIDRQGKVCSPEAKWYSSFVGGWAFATSEHFTESWIIDTQMQRHEMNTQANVCVGGEEISYLCRFGPPRTVFDNQYIVSHDGPYSGPNEAYLIIPKTGVKCDMRWSCLSAFNCITPRRIHVAWNEGNVEHHGFLNEDGELCLEFEKDEF